jgi:hypothetical protein
MTMEPKRKYAYCEACERFSYRIPGCRHDDGRVDSDDSPVWLLTDRETIESEGIDPDAVPAVECCGVILTEEAIVERLRAAIAAPAGCTAMVEDLIKRLDAQLAAKERDICVLATKIQKEHVSLTWEEALHQARWRYADQGRRAGVHLQCRTPPDSPTLGWFHRQKL